MVLEHAIAQHHDKVHACAHDAHRRIIEDDDRLPCFTKASQNIATAAALLRGFRSPRCLRGTRHRQDPHVARAHGGVAGRELIISMMQCQPSYTIGTTR
jgi:hypothetical protein